MILPKIGIDLSYSFIGSVYPTCFTSLSIQPFHQSDRWQFGLSDIVYLKCSKVVFLISYTQRFFKIVGIKVRYNKGCTTFLNRVGQIPQHFVYVGSTLLRLKSKQLSDNV